MFKRIITKTCWLLLLSSEMAGISKPKVLSPLNNSNISSLEPTFSWKYNNQPGVLFEIKIGEDNELTQNTITLLTPLTNLHFNLPYFRPGKIYYWSVRAVVTEKNVQVKSDWVMANKKAKTSFKFMISESADGFVGNQPVIVHPGIGEVLNTLKPVFQWDFPDFRSASFKILNVNNEWVKPYLEKITYHLQVSTSGSFENDFKTFEIKDTNAISLTIPVFRKGLTYYWRVKAFYHDPEKEKIKESDWSYSIKKNIPASFKIAAEAAGVFGFEEGMKEELFDPYKLSSAEKISNGNYNYFAPAVSLDGTRLAFCSDKDDQTEIYIKNLEERVGGGETRKTLSSKGISNLNPFWLINNLETGFYSNRYNIETIWELFSTTKGTGTSVTFQTNRMEMEEDPENFNLYGSCSADGKIVFTGKFRNNKIYRLFLKDLQDNSLTELRPGMFPSINNYDVLVFASDEKGDGNYEILKVELEGHSINNPSVLAPDEASDYDPAFSPDGSRIVFTSTRSGNSDIWIMNSDGTDLRQLTFHPLADRRPQWINNETIVFQSNRVNNSENTTMWNLYKMAAPK